MSAPLNKNEKQSALNDLYREFREKGDDPLNARLRLISFAQATEEESVIAQNALGEFNDDYNDDEE